MNNKNIRNMKRLIVFFSLVLCATIEMPAQIRTCCFFDDFWSEWTPSESFKVQGDFNSFIVYDENDGPWGYFLKLTIDNFAPVPKKQRKKDLKQKDVVKYEYTGKVEYYLPDYGGAPNTTIYDLFKYAKRPFFWPKENKDESAPKIKKVVSNATIKVYRYENTPQYYVIYFDKVGAGFYLDKNYFSNSSYNFDK